MINVYILSVIAVCLVGRCNSRPNVLFVTIDDLRPELGCYRGDHYPVPVSPEMRTPHMDGLADQSLLLMRAHSQLTICNPSRTSLLTGRRPDSTKVWENKRYFREMSGNYTTLPQYFKQNGYISQGMGKIFHQQDDPPSWSQPYYNAPNNGYWSEKEVSWQAVSAEDREETPLPDDQLVSHAIDSLRQYAPAALAGEMNFFMAVGFYKPHQPFAFSQIKRDDYMGYSIRSDRYRYNEFPRFDEDAVMMDWNDLDGVELYDHTIDPDENINRAHDEEYLDVIEELQEKLHDGWRAVIQ